MCRIFIYNLTPLFYHSSQGPTLPSHLEVPPWGPNPGPLKGSHQRVLSPGSQFSGMPFSQGCTRATVSMKQEKYCFESIDKISYRSKRNKNICFWVFCKKSQKIFKICRNPCQSPFVVKSQPGRAYKKSQSKGYLGNFIKNRRLHR